MYTWDHIVVKRVERKILKVGLILDFEDNLSAANLSH